MKKFLTLLLLALFAGTNTCLAMSELYYFKDINTASVANIVNNTFTEQGFNVIKSDPYYAVSPQGDDYAIIILQQSGNNMFYYYKSENNTKVNKAVLKAVKKLDVVCEQSFNSGIISIYDNIAENMASSAGELKKYTFEDEPIYSQPLQTVQTKTQNTLSGYIARLGTGTKIPAYLQDSINTATANKGDSVTAVVSDNVMYNGAVVIPQGSVIHGSLTKARHATYGSQNGKAVITFNKIVTPENTVYNITADTVDFSVTNEGKISGSVQSAAKAAAAGAIIGLLFGLISSDKNVWKSAAVGAGVGAGGSVIYSTAERGVDAEIPSFTEIEVVLKSPLNVTVNN